MQWSHQPRSIVYSLAGWIKLEKLWRLTEPSFSSPNLLPSGILSGYRVSRASMLSVLSGTSWVSYVAKILSSNEYFANTTLDWSVLQRVVVDPTTRGAAY